MADNNDQSTQDNVDDKPATTDSAENQGSEPEQLELEFVNPDEFDSFDDVDSEEVVLGDDTFDESSADFDKEGCGCVQ